MFLFICTILSCISLFLFGIELLSGTLENLLESKILKAFNICTKNIFLSFIVGIFFTFLTQSSTIVTAIMIALVSSGVLDVKKGIAILMGANIGTTFTVYIANINVNDYSYLFIFLGFFFLSIKKAVSLGKIFFGLGILFLSVYLIKSSLTTLINNDFIISNTLKNTTSILGGILWGTIIAFIVQSSSLVITLTQSLFNSKLITLSFGLALMLGANIGTTFSGLIASLKQKENAKILAIAHILYNVFGVIIFFPFINLIIYLLKNFYSYNIINHIHLLFNILSSLVGLFFINKLEVLSRKLNNLF